MSYNCKTIDEHRKKLEESISKGSTWLLRNQIRIIKLKSFLYSNDRIFTIKLL